MRVVLIFLLLICAVPLPVQALPSPEAGVAQSLPVRRIAILSGNVRHPFDVMVARSDAEQEVGLMWRQSMAPDEGMIFPFGSPRVASFWMRNTLIPLDILFVRADGTIANIAASAEPLSLKPLSSAGKVKAVLEIPGGRAAQLGIKAGDRLRW
jgi:uncharacterized protein